MLMWVCYCKATTMQQIKVKFITRKSVSGSGVKTHPAHCIVGCRLLQIFIVDCYHIHVKQMLNRILYHNLLNYANLITGNQ